MSWKHPWHFFYTCLWLVPEMHELTECVSTQAGALKLRSFVTDRESGIRCHCSHKVWKVFLNEHLDLGDQKSTWMPVYLSKIGLASLHLLHSSTDTTQQNIIFGCLITALLKLKQVPALFSENIYFRYSTSERKPTLNKSQIIPTPLSP